MTKTLSFLRRLAFLALPLLLIFLLVAAMIEHRPKLIVGKTVPDFTARSFDGQVITLSQFKGHPVFLNFWSSDCVSCRLEAPDLVRTHKKFEDTELAMIGIDSDDLDAPGRAFLKEFGVSYLNLKDARSKIKASYGVRAFPESFFISREGKLIERVYGPMTSAEMASKVQALLTLR